MSDAAPFTVRATLAPAPPDGRAAVYVHRDDLVAYLLAAGAEMRGVAAEVVRELAAKLRQSGSEPPIGTLPPPG